MATPPSPRRTGTEATPPSPRRTGTGATPPSKWLTDRSHAHLLYSHRKPPRSHLPLSKKKKMYAPSFTSTATEATPTSFTRADGHRGLILNLPCSVRCSESFHIIHSTFPRKRGSALNDPEHGKRDTTSRSCSFSSWTNIARSILKTVEGGSRSRNGQHFITVWVTWIRGRGDRIAPVRSDTLRLS